MVLKRVLPARKSKLCVTAQSSRNMNKDLIDMEEETEHSATAATPNGSATHERAGHMGLGLTENFGLELFFVIGCAILFRRLWILHGIHFIVLRRTLRLAIAWIDYFFDAGIYEEVKRTAVYIYRLSMSHTEKALSGDSVRLFFAASSLQQYSSWGYHIVFAVLRRQYKIVNKLALNEQEDNLQRTEMLVERRREQGEQHQS